MRPINGWIWIVLRRGGFAKPLFSRVRACLAGSARERAQPGRVGANHGPRIGPEGGSGGEAKIRRKGVIGPRSGLDGAGRSTLRRMGAGAPPRDGVGLRDRAHSGMGLSYGQHDRCAALRATPHGTLRRAAARLGAEAAARRRAWVARESALLYRTRLSRDADRLRGRARRR